MTIELHLTRVDHGEAQFGEDSPNCRRLRGRSTIMPTGRNETLAAGVMQGGDQLGPSWCTVQWMSVSGW